MEISGVRKDKKNKHDEDFSAFFEKEFDRFNKITQTDPKKPSTFYEWGSTLFLFAEINQDIDSYKSSIDKYYKAEQLGFDFISPLNNCGLYYWGLALYKLVENIEEIEFQKYFNSFERASKKTNDPDTLLIKGELYFILKRSNDEVKECFLKFKKKTF